MLRESPNCNKKWHRSEVGNFPWRFPLQDFVTDVINFEGYVDKSIFMLIVCLQGTADFVCGTLARIQEMDHKVRDVTPKKLSCVFTSSKLEQSL